MNRLHTLVLLGMMTLTADALAQASLAGTRLAASSATSARFSLGLSLDNGASYVTAATTSDNLRIIGAIQPETSQLNQNVDVFVVANLNGSYFMRNSSGSFVPWSGDVPSLVPFRTGVTLTGNTAVDFLTGKIPVVGTFSLFLGYKAADGVLTYTPAPHQITINAPPEPTPTVSPLQEAQDFFNSKIESPVIQSRCVTCHISGGLAASSGMTFLPTSDSRRFTNNFNSLRNALRTYGRTGLLSRSMGLSGHGGGAQFSSTNEQAYRDLDTFLQMAEKL